MTEQAGGQRRKIMIRRTLMAVGAVLMLLLLFQVVEYFTYTSGQQRAAITQGTETTAQLKAEIESLLQTVEAEAERLGESFGENDFTEDEVKDLIRQTALDFPEIRGVTACYTPDAFAPGDPGKRLFCPYYNKGSQSYVFVEDSYDYTVKGDGTAWYTGVVENGKVWTDPYFGSAAQEWYIDYGVPFYFKSGPRAGEVRGIIDFSLEAGDFKNLIHSISVGKTGYGIITSKSGAIITHPIGEYVGTKNLNDLKSAETSSSLLTAYDGMLAGESGRIQFFDELNNDTSLFYYDHIDTADFGLGVSFFKRDLMANARATNRRYINMAITLSIIFVIALILYFGRDTLDRFEIEQISALATLLLLGNVFLIGSLQHTTADAIASNESPAILDVSSLGNFVGSENARADLMKTERPTPIPTGIYIERLEFQDSYNVNIGGSVWQKYPLSVADDVEVGFALPQMSPFAEASYIEETFRERVEGKEGEEGYLHVKWDIRVTLRLDLTYGDFPFDKRHLDIELRPSQQSDNLILVPDLESYSYTNPSRLAGLNKDIKLPGNLLTRSYFNFTSKTVETDFGFQSKEMFQSIPVLHYNVHMKRRLLNAFVTYLIPIFVAMSLIYILIMACEKTEARQGIIESMAAFFFVLIFSHIDLRKDIVTADLIFIEFFYFITYLMIILSTANLIVYTKDKSAIFDYNENQLYRAVYFPIFFMLLLTVMIWKFY